VVMKKNLLHHPHPRFTRMVKQSLCSISALPRGKGRPIEVAQLQNRPRETRAFL
jgi:hypothetical protein